MKGVQTHLLQWPRPQLLIQTEDSLRPLEAQQTANGLLQRDQAANPTVPRWVLVLPDIAAAQRWLLERFQNRQYPTAASESAWDVPLLDPGEDGRLQRVGTELLPLTRGAVKPQGQSQKSDRYRQRYR